MKKMAPQGLLTNAAPRPAGRPSMSVCPTSCPSVAAMQAFDSFTSRGGARYGGSWPSAGGAELAVLSAMEGNDLRTRGGRRIAAGDAAAGSVYASSSPVLLTAATGLPPDPGMIMRPAAA
jgi:hypothetical protein